MEITAWLRDLGLERYVQAFLDAEVTPEILTALTDADLRELGLPLGPRKVVIKAIEALADPSAASWSGNALEVTALRPCPYQKLRPTVLVVQATEDGHRNDPPDLVDRSMDWSVFVQRQVSPELVVIRDVGCDDAAEMSLAEHDEMVETLPSDRADQPFDVSVLPR